MVDHARATWQVSIRRACRALPVDRSTYHYRSRRTGQAGLGENGSRRSPKLACVTATGAFTSCSETEGWEVNAKRVCRLYREMGLQLRNKTPKRRVTAKLRSDRTTATAVNDIWAMDFVHDQLLKQGTKIRALTIVDTFSRFSPAGEPRFNFAAPMLWRCSKGRPRR